MAAVKRAGITSTKLTARDTMGCHETTGCGSELCIQLRLCISTCPGVFPFLTVPQVRVVFRPLRRNLKRIFNRRLTVAPFQCISWE